MHELLIASESLSFLSHMFSSIQRIQAGIFHTESGSKVRKYIFFHLTPLANSSASFILTLDFGLALIHSCWHVSLTVNKHFLRLLCVSTCVCIEICVWVCVPNEINILWPQKFVEAFQSIEHSIYTHWKNVEISSNEMCVYVYAHIYVNSSQSRENKTQNQIEV